MSKKSRKTPKQKERIDRMEATFQMVDVMPLLGALSISLSDGDYKRGYNACESIVRLIYSVQLRCVCMERMYR
jgi:hypothetical protein